MQSWIYIKLSCTFAADFLISGKAIMQKNLVIVESPAKAKTIEKFLGKDFKVLSSYGHIRDLKTKEFSIDIEHNYEPQYEIPDDKKKIVATLKSEAKAAEIVWLASDEDREGEAISWHLQEVLKLKPETTRRIVFHEITKNAILHAIETPRTIDMNLVNAQQARRVLDRIVGFQLSPILWKKVKPALSAGRVQSVAVRLIVEREREINEFISEAAYRVVANFILSDGSILKAELNRRIKTKEEAKQFLEACKQATFTVEDISQKPFRKSPAPPFTTSTLQQEAARKLGYSVGQTMRIAQSLYESGLITYMRTDSFNLSDLALHTAKDTILEAYGEKYHKYRQYHTSSKGAQEAHEAIRPTYIANAEISGSAQEKKLYDLIRKRTIASQMADAELERTTISVSIGGLAEKFIATGEVIVFDGFLQVYLESTDDENEKEQQENGLLPRVNPNDTLQLKDMVATERFSQRPFRYTEASLVRRLEELGIGRPSTYAPTIQTILTREYVIKGNKEGFERSYSILTLNKKGISEKSKTEIAGADRNKLMPTDIGMVVNDFLMEYFQLVMDYNFTANVEKDFDAIAGGEMNWTQPIDRFYQAFHPIVEQTTSLRMEHKIGERELGTDPESGKPVFVKIGRFGPMVQIGDSNSENKDEKPRFAALLKEQSIETITLEEALKLFELPRTIGDFEGKTVVAAVGRFGPFLRHDGKFISLPKELDPRTVTLEEAVELIHKKRTDEAQRLIKTFEEEPELQIMNGRFGPYIAYKGKNHKIPKTGGYVPAEMSLDDCMKLIQESTEKPTTKKRTIRKK